MQKLDAFERDLLLKGIQEGRRAVRLDYVPTARRSAAGVEHQHACASAWERWRRSCASFPISLPSSDGDAGGIAFAMLLLTSRSDQELAAAAGVDAGAGAAHLRGRPRRRPGTASRRRWRRRRSRLPELETSEDAPRRNLLRVDVARVDDAMERLALLIVTRSRLARAIATLAATGADTRELAADRPGERAPAPRSARVRSSRCAWCR